MIKEDTAVLQKRQNVLVGSETGNPVSCDDAFTAPLCGLTVYGKSTQDGTPSPDAPVPIVSAGDGAGVRLDYQRDVNIAIKRIEDAVASMT